MTPANSVPITAIAQFPVVPTGTGPWNINNPLQPWSDPAIAAALAEDPTQEYDLAVYTTWKINAATGAVTTYQFGVPYSQAAVSNVPPANLEASPNPATIIQSGHNVPLDMTQLKPGGKYAGWTIAPGPVSINSSPTPILVPPAAAAPPVPAGTDPVLAAILANSRQAVTLLKGTPQ